MASILRFSTKLERDSFDQEAAPIVRALVDHFTKELKRHRSRKLSLREIELIDQMLRDIFDWERGCEARWEGQTFDGAQSEGWQAGWRDVDDQLACC